MLPPYSGSISFRRPASALDYPTRPVRWIVGYPPGGATDIMARLFGQLAVGEARPAVHHREQAGRRQQYRHRGGGECRRPTATRSCWSIRRTRINATLYNKLTFNFIRDIAPVAGIVARAERDGGATRACRPRPSPSSSPTPRPIPARSTWPRPATAPRCICPANCSRR